MYKKHPTDEVTDGVRSPVNRVAARVVMRGEHWRPNTKLQEVEQNAPFVLRDVKALMKVSRSLDDLTGRKFGSFTVMGLSEYKERWSVRCVCGTYTLRSKKAITNPANDVDACKRCRDLRWVQREYIRKSTGRNVDVCDLPGVVRRFSGT